VLSQWGGDLVSLALILAGAGVALYFLSQYGHLDYPIKSGLVHRIGQALSRVSPRLSIWRPHPNQVASFLVGTLPVGVGLIPRLVRGWRRGLVAGATVLIALALAMTVSRGAWVSLGVTLTLALALRGRRWAVLIAILCLLIALGSVVILGLRGDARLQDVPVLGDLATALVLRADRISVWHGALDLISQHVFTGIRLGHTFPAMYSHYVLLIQPTFLTCSHNLALEVWLQQGILGAIGFIWLIVAFYVFVGQTVRNALPLPGGFQGAWLGATAILVHGLFDAVQYAASRLLVAFSPAGHGRWSCASLAFEFACPARRQQGLGGGCTRVGRDPAGADDVAACGQPGLRQRWRAEAGAGRARARVGGGCSGAALALGRGRFEASNRLGCGQ